MAELETGAGASSKRSPGWSCCTSEGQALNKIFMFESGVPSLPGAQTVPNPRQAPEVASAFPPESPLKGRLQTPRFRCVFTPFELRFLCVSLVVVSLLFLLIAIATNNWKSDGQMSIGLWNACLQTKCYRAEHYTQSKTVPHRVIHAMLFLAVCCAFGCLFFLGVSFVQKQVKSIPLVLLASIASLTAGAFIVTGMSVYTYELYKEKAVSQAHWSFYVAWISSGFFFLAGATIFLIRRTEK
ncbi:lens fiber membrane intrinsic protein-like isoform X2 [Hemicordylus capensis]|nr:lens fiber membrane intrinsic protein-like isoform X2 [Hemicordylus capensis]XP_053124031.1 lens fiber membrane intrinsic protein-like isoform X2 [Hemicordylus capensis]XP_053124032.1 lens fiber membrane intrinsic protein-like isoform X2 [Hemicordylus capensis]XP_053124033.1 lens fiber membrane intrinsic protein-like isoform X2 [Hemicordylus capensis]